MHLWYVDVPRLPDGCLERYPALLSPAERERWQRYRFEKDRRLYLVAWALVRTVLSRYQPRFPSAWRFTTNPYGKPEIASEPGLAPLCFNLSHTDGLVVCAVTLGRAVGVDVENLERSESDLDIAEQYFAPAESAYLKGLTAESRTEAFFAFWTLKEAYVKARGQGLSLPLEAFAFTLEPLGIAFAPPLEDDDPGRWQFARYRLGRHHCLAVAVSRRPGQTLAIHLRETVP